TDTLPIRSGQDGIETLEECSMRAAKSILVTLVLVASAASAQNNSELAQMFAADQAARRSPNINWEDVRKEDEERRSAVMSILATGGIQTALDYYNAAMIFQHGDSAEDIRLAHAFATISSTLGNSSASNWLMAASWDRLMLQFEQPQWRSEERRVGRGGGSRQWRDSQDIGEERTVE